MPAISFVDHRHGPFSKSMEGRKKAGNSTRPSDHLTAMPVHPRAAAEDGIQTALRLPAESLPERPCSSS
jgi:hypothetical protein